LVNKLTAFAVVLSVGMCCYSAHAGDVYYLKQDGGTLHVAKQALDNQYRAYQVFADTLLPLQIAFARDNLRASLRPTLQELGKRHGLSADLLDAVIQAESAYNPDAVSHKGAIGLMQLMPATAVQYGVKDPRDPRENVRGGATHLAGLIKRYGALTLSLAAYNAGERAVDLAGGIPPYPETQAYVKKVLALYESKRK
jgi:soluble lytic murein transglycosylase-like protein